MLAYLKRSRTYAHKSVLLDNTKIYSYLPNDIAIYLSSE